MTYFAKRAKLDGPECALFLLITFFVVDFRFKRLLRRIAAWIFPQRGPGIIVAFLSEIPCNGTPSNCGRAADPH